jgi:hypothetical protein
MDGVDAFGRPVAGPNHAEMDGVEAFGRPSADSSRPKARRLP